MYKDAFGELLRAGVMAYNAELFTKFGPSAQKNPTPKEIMIFKETLKRWTDEVAPGENRSVIAANIEQAFNNRSRTLELKNLQGVTTLPDLSQLKITHLFIGSEEEDAALTEIPTLPKGLERLNITRCPIKHLCVPPDNRLTNLTAKGCSELTEWDGSFSHLKSLTATGCGSLTKLPEDLALTVRLTLPYQQYDRYFHHKLADVFVKRFTTELKEFSERGADYWAITNLECPITPQIFDPIKDAAEEVVLVCTDPTVEKSKARFGLFSAKRFSDLLKHQIDERMKTDPPCDPSDIQAVQLADILAKCKPGLPAVIQHPTSRQALELKRYYDIVEPPRQMGNVKVGRVIPPN